MTLVDIEKKAKLITDKGGKPVEVILPYGIYRHLLELETTIEIFQRKETQASIKRAKEDIRQSRTKSFTDVRDALEWLDK